MKIFAFDQKDKDEWYKNWHDLGQIDVIKCNSSSDRKEAISNIFNIAVHESVLVLIHQECCQNFFKEFITEIQHNEKIFVMFVTGGNQPLFDDNSLPHIHYSKRALSTGTELTSFKNLFSNLCFELEQAGEHNKIKSAWDNWEYLSLTTLDNKNNSKLIHDLKSFLNFTKSLSVSNENIAKIDFNKLPEDFINQLNSIRKTLEPLYSAEYIYENQTATNKNGLIRLLVIDDQYDYPDINDWIRYVFQKYSVEFCFSNAFDNEKKEYSKEKALKDIENLKPDGIILDMWFGDKKLGLDIFKSLDQEFQTKTLIASSGDINDLEQFSKLIKESDEKKTSGHSGVIAKLAKDENIDLEIDKFINYIFINYIRNEKNNLDVRYDEKDFIDDYLKTHATTTKSNPYKSPDFIANTPEKLTKENILPSFKNHRQRFWHDELSFLCQAVELTKNTKGINRVEAARILKNLKDPEEGSSNDFDRWFRQVWRDLDLEHKQKAKARQETDMPLLTKIFEELKLEGLKKPKKEQKERAKVGTQYYDPDSQQTWVATRGGKAMPLWLRNLIASGRKLSEFEVKE